MAVVSHVMQEYKYKGRLVGAFFDEQGFPTALSRRMWEASARHKGAVEERKNKRLSYPDCSTRWSSNSGVPGVCSTPQLLLLRFLGAWQR